MTVKHRLLHARRLCSLFVGAFALTTVPAIAQAQVQATVLQEQQGFIDIEFDLGELSITPDARGDLEVKLPGEASTMQQGAPSLPVLSRIIAVPRHAKARIEILEQERYTQNLDAPVAPVQPQPTRCGDEKVPYLKHSAFYEATPIYPLETVQLGDSFSLRGTNFARVKLSPVQYDASQNRLHVTSRISIRVHFEGSNARAMPEHHLLEPGFSPDLLGSLPHVPSAAQRTMGVPSMLIIIGQEAYREKVQELATWKERRGLNVEIRSVQELGGNTTKSIFAGIQKMYKDDRIDLRFVLLVGEKDVTNYKLPNAQDTDRMGESDYRYTLLDGTDEVGDVLIGRIAAKNADDVAKSVAKVLYYERDMGQEDDDRDLSWIETAVGIASSESASGPSDIQRMETIVGRFSKAGYGTIDEFYQGQGASPAKLQSVLSEGRGFISYMGHGTGNAWAFKSGFRFTNSNVTAIKASKRWPVIMDCACSNGDFLNREPAFAEVWQRAGTVSDPHGSLGIVSSTILAAWNEPAVMADEMFRAILEQPSITMGGMLRAGLMKMASTFPGSITMKTTRDTFLLFGDPSIPLRTFVPSRPKVQTTRSEDQTLQVSVTRKKRNASQQIAAFPATVALSLDGELIAVGETDKDGQVELEVPKDLRSETLDLVVTGFSLVAHQDTIRLKALDEDSQSSETDSEGGQDSQQGEGSEDNDKTQESDKSPDKSKKSSGKSKSSKATEKSKKKGQGKEDEDRSASGCNVQEPNSLPGGIFALLGLVAWARRRCK